MSTRAYPPVEAPHEHEHRDPLGAKTGMWVFLFTEMLLFGGLFLVYIVLRHQYGEAFHHAAGELDVTIGVINTVMLLTSSLTMVVAVVMLQRGRRGWALLSLHATMALGGFFLVAKAGEWSMKINHGLFPGFEHLGELPHGEGLFFNLYFIMTGLHGLHVLAGLVAMYVARRRLLRGTLTPDNQGLLEYTGLYWHLVDLIWIFLLPLFYLTT